ncbi:MAG: SRPBCC family protein [Chloroflexi bacterium]|nr:SRPBCC family protein [Chloroflexota bacterium]
MVHVEAAIVIARPLAEVFAFAADPVNDAAWNDPIVATEILTPDVRGVGLRFRHTVRFLGQQFTTTGEVIDYEENARACVRATGGPLESTGCRLFTAVDGGAVLTVRLDGAARGVLRLGEAVAGKAAQRQLELDLARLKALLEAGGQ